MSGEEAVKLSGNPGLKGSVLIVVWAEDACNLGVQAADYLSQSLGCREFGEVLPQGFFPMGGVNVVEDVARFPESKFYVCDHSNIVIFKSSIPRMGWYRFLTSVLDVAYRDCAVKEIYTVGAMISTAAHTVPRLLITIVNNKEIKSALEPYNVVADNDYETAPGQKPTLSSYLAWLAGQRNIPAVNLWVPVPYYLVSTDDPRAVKRLVYFFNSKFDLGVDFTALDSAIAGQNNKIARLFDKSPEIKNMVRRLEVGDGLDGEESEKLAREIAQALK
ncbi:MAG: PAC2 family protein [Dehalococcoidia bacterium]|nr:PAC2 family protein [Dehalococcoidia bacterium]